LADTVGFIRHLPHELVSAFRSTLQEASEAELLLHVIDANAKDRDETIFQVNEVLSEIDAGSIKQLQVFNKIDLLENITPHIDYNDEGKPIRVWLSAQTSAGIELLYQALAELFTSSKVKRKFYLSPTQGGVRAKLFDFAKIINEETDNYGGWNLAIEIDKKYLGLLKSIEMEEII